MEFELGFVGAGNMAEAIARAAIDKGIVSIDAMVAADPVERRREVFSDLGIRVMSHNAEVITQSKQVLLAVKPQTLRALGADLNQIDPQQQVVVSIMAGVSTKRIEATSQKPLRTVRIMPNTPLMVGCGMAAIATGRYARNGDDTLAMKLFAAAGKAIRVSESDLDAITAVSGSGPAYVFYLAEAMAQAAEELGLGRDAALLVEQTILGAARLLADSDDSPQELRRKVTSPGGTTEAAVQHLDGNSTSQVIVNAIKAACKRSEQLGSG